MSVRIILNRNRLGRDQFFRVILSTCNNKKRYKQKEKLGWYNPKSMEKHINMDRVKYWVSHGAQISEAVKARFAELNESTATADQIDKTVEQAL